MKLIKPSFEILTDIDKKEVLQVVERAARTCYKSEDKITTKSANELVGKMIDRKHGAMLEFFDVTVRFICDRGVSHEIVRHRLASYAQESTRYCNYSRLKFGRQLTFIIPEWMNLTEGDYDHIRIIQAAASGTEKRIWMSSMYESENDYLNLVDLGWSAQKARSVLPNSLKTEIVMKANLREWRHFFSLRCSKAAHPQMRELAIPLLKQMKKRVPLIFDDIIY